MRQVCQTWIPSLGDYIIIPFYLEVPVTIIIPFTLTGIRLRVPVAQAAQVHVERSFNN